MSARFLISRPPSLEPSLHHHSVNAPEGQAPRRCGAAHLGQKYSRPSIGRQEKNPVGQWRGSGGRERVSELARSGVELASACQICSGLRLRTTSTTSSDFDSERLPLRGQSDLNRPRSILPSVPSGFLVKKSVRTVSKRKLRGSAHTRRNTSKCQGASADVLACDSD